MVPVSMNTFQTWDVHICDELNNSSKKHFLPLIKREQLSSLCKLDDLQYLK